MKFPFFSLCVALASDKLFKVVFGEGRANIFLLPAVFDLLLASNICFQIANSH